MTKTVTSPGLRMHRRVHGRALLWAWNFTGWSFGWQTQETKNQLPNVPKTKSSKKCCETHILKKNKKGDIESRQAHFEATVMAALPLQSREGLVVPPCPGGHETQWPSKMTVWRDSGAPCPPSEPRVTMLFKIGRVERGRKKLGLFSEFRRTRSLTKRTQLLLWDYQKTIKRTIKKKTHSKIIQKKNKSHPMIRSETKPPHVPNPKRNHPRGLGQSRAQLPGEQRRWRILERPLGNLFKMCC